MIQKILCILCCLVSITIAQVNIEQYRDQAGNLEEKYHEHFNISTSLRRSTTSFYKVRLKYFRPFYFRRGNGFLISNVNYGETDNNPFINDSFYHLRYIAKDAFFNVIPELFVQFENNSYSETKQRYLVGVGVRYRQGLSTSGTSVINESYKESDGILKLNNWRISQYLKAKFNLNQRNKLNVTLYIQPSIFDFSDIRYYSQSSYVSEINQMISYQSTLTAKFFSKSNTFNQVEYFFDSGLRFKL